MSVIKSIRKFVKLPEKRTLLIFIIESIPIALKQLMLTGKIDLKIVWDDPKKVKQVS